MNDPIDRQAAIDAILAVTGNSSVRELYEHVQEHGLSDMWSGGVNAAIDIIIAVPSAQPDVPDTNVGELISRREIEAYIMKCPYFAGKNTIDRSNIGTHIGSCDLEHHYRKVCPSNECLCAERLGLKNG